VLSACSRVRNSPTLRVLKVIHGHGSTGRGGSSREVVRNWAFRNRHRLRAVIPGESYEVSDADTHELRIEIGQYPDSDLGKGNPGITLLWIK